jgi:phosphoribosylformimino-5-aminoimidazole carboxamide ribotide isomerase
MEIIPAIDLIDGKCVRLSRGDFSKMTTYNEDPLEVAKTFEDHGIRRLHLVDLDGARTGKIVNHKILEKIASKTKLFIDYGGGLKTSEDVKMAFESGARQITGGTIAVKSPEIFQQWLKEFGSDRIILGADFDCGKIVINGWQTESDLTLLEFLTNYSAQGIQYCIPTDVSRDGLLQGSAIQTYKTIIEHFPSINLIASGGVTAYEELEKLDEIGCFGVIIGKALYEGRIQLNQLKPFLI